MNSEYYRPLQGNYRSDSSRGRTRSALFNTNAYGKVMDPLSTAPTQLYLI